MPWKVYSFDGLTLPNTDSVDLSPGKADTDYLKLPGGKEWDAYKGDRSRVQHVSIQTEVWATGANSAGLRTTVDNIFGRLGKRGTLIRADDAGTQQSMTARLTNVDGERTPGNITFQPLSLTFEGSEYPWKSTTRTTTGTTASFVLTNVGTYPITNPIITITAPGGGALSKVEVAYTPGEWGHCHWAVTTGIAAGTSLVIDCGAFTVMNNGVSAYNSFALDATHSSPHWLTLSTGTNTLTLTITGTAGAGWSVSHWDGFG